MFISFINIIDIIEKQTFLFVCSLREDAERVLEETLSEYGFRLSPLQTARVFRALARNKASADPRGCVTAYRRAMELVAASFGPRS